MPTQSDSSTLSQKLSAFLGQPAATLWPRILSAAFTVLIFGIVYIFLSHLNAIPDKLIEMAPSDLNPVPFAGAAALLVVLTMMGVPVIPAAIAGVSVWWLVQTLFF